MTKPGAGGVYIPVLPLDVLILKGLPKEGTIFQEVYPEGDTAIAITKRINKPGVNTRMVSTRLRVMHLGGLTTTVRVPRQSTAGWQITKKGEEFYFQHQPDKGVSSGS